MTDADFKQALNYVTHGPKASLSDKQRLGLYALYKVRAWRQNPL